jgi:hypothetical protein
MSRVKIAILILLTFTMGACSAQTTATTPPPDAASTTSSVASSTSSSELTSTTSSTTTTADGDITIGSELDPGTYTSAVFETPITFTVPEGWKVFEDEPGQFGLARIANDGPPLLVLRDVRAAATDCSERPEDGVGHTAEEFTAWLAAHEGLTTTDPAPVTVGGLDGMVLDISLDESWTTPCPFSGGQPLVMTLVGTSISRGLHWGIDATEEQRVWVLDLPQVDGGNIVIMADACCGVTPDEQLSAAQQVVESFTFQG